MAFNAFGHFSGTCSDIMGISYIEGAYHIILVNETNSPLCRDIEHVYVSHLEPEPSSCPRNGGNATIESVMVLKC